MPTPLDSVAAFLQEPDDQPTPQVQAPTYPNLPAHSQAAIDAGRAFGSPGGLDALAWMNQTNSGNMLTGQEQQLAAKLIDERTANDMRVSGSTNPDLYLADIQETLRRRFPAAQEQIENLPKTALGDYAFQKYAGEQAALPIKQLALAYVNAGSQNSSAVKDQIEALSPDDFKLFQFYMSKYKDKGEAGAGSTLESLASGYHGMVQTGLEFASNLEDLLPDSVIANPHLMPRSEQYWKAEQLRRQLTSEQQTGWDKPFQTLVQMSPQIATDAALAELTPAVAVGQSKVVPASIAFWTTQMQPGMRDAAIAEGADPKVANAVSMFFAPLAATGMHAVSQAVQGNPVLSTTEKSVVQRNILDGIWNWSVQQAKTGASINAGQATMEFANALNDITASAFSGQSPDAAREFQKMFTEHVDSLKVNALMQLPGAVGQLPHVTDVQAKPPAEMDLSEPQIFTPGNRETSLEQRQNRLLQEALKPTATEKIIGAGNDALNKIIEPVKAGVKEQIRREMSEMWAPKEAAKLIRQRIGDWWDSLPPWNPEKPRSLSRSEVKDMGTALKDSGVPDETVKALLDHLQSSKVRGTFMEDLASVSAEDAKPAFNRPGEPPADQGQQQIAQATDLKAVEARVLANDTFQRWLSDRKRINSRFAAIRDAYQTGKELQQGRPGAALEPQGYTGNPGDVTTPTDLQNTALKRTNKVGVEEPPMDTLVARLDRWLANPKVAKKDGLPTNAEIDNLANMTGTKPRKGLSREARLAGIRAELAARDKQETAKAEAHHAEKPPKPAPKPPPEPGKPGKEPPPEPPKPGEKPKPGPKPPKPPVDDGEFAADKEEAAQAEKQAEQKAKQKEQARDKHVEAKTKLPPELAKAAPTYGYKEGSYDIDFVDDTEKALYIIGSATEGKKSKRHADYVKFLEQSRPGSTEEQMVKAGNELRKAIKKEAARLYKDNQMSGLIETSTLDVGGGNGNLHGFVKYENRPAGTIESRTGRDVVPENPKFKGIYDIIDSIKQAFPKVQFKVGNVAGNRSAVYDEVRRIVAVSGKAAGELAQHVHEATHDLDLQNHLTDKMDAEARVDLGKFAADQRQSKISEALPILLDGYVLHPDEFHTIMKAAYPDLYNYVMGDLHSQFPKQMQAFDKAQVDYQRYKAADPVTRVVYDDSTTPPERSTLHTFWSKLNGMLFSDMPIQEKLVNRVNRARKNMGLPELPADMSPTDIMQYSGKQSANMGAQFFKEGIYNPATGKRMSKGIVEIFEALPVEKRQPAYAFARAMHEIDKSMQGKFGGKDIHQYFDIYNKFKGDKEIRRAAKEITNHFNAGLDLLVQANAGLDPVLVERLKELWPNYVPAKRVVGEAFKHSTGAKGTGAAKVIKKLTGEQTDLQMENYILTMQERDNLIARKYAQLEHVKALLRLSEEYPEQVGQIISVIPEAPDSERGKQWKQLQQLMTANVKDLKPEAQDQLATLLTTLLDDFVDGKPRPGADSPQEYRGQAPGPNEYLIPFWNPKTNSRAYFSMHPELAKEWLNVDPKRLWPVIKATFGVATWFKRAGAVTLNTPFLMTNAIRDLQTVGVRAEGNPVSNIGRVFPEYLRGIKDAIGRATGKESLIDPLRKIMREMGYSERTTYWGNVQEARSMVPELLNDPELATKNGVMVTMGDFARKVIDVAGSPSNIIEEAPRSEAARRSLEQDGYTTERLGEILAKGDMIPSDVLVRAAKAYALSTVDFGRGAPYMKLYSQVDAFRNAPLQGLAQSVDLMMRKPVQVIARGAMLFTLPTALAWWRNHDKDWYKEMPAWKKYGFYHIQLGNDPLGRDVIRIPRAYDFGLLFSSLFELGLNEATVSDKGPEFKDWFQQNIVSTDPGRMLDFMPDLLQPSMEAFFNYSAFTNSEIENSHMRGLPHTKAYWSTTEASKWAADKLSAQTGAEISPIKLDYIAKNMLGGFTRQFSGSAGLAETSDSKVESGKSVTQFYDQNKHLHDVIDSAKEPEHEDLVNVTVQDFAGGMMKALRQEFRRTDESGKEIYDSAQQQNSLRYLTGMSKLALDKGESKAYPNPVNADFSPEFSAERDALFQHVYNQLNQKRPNAGVKDYKIKLEKWKVAQEAAKQIMSKYDITTGQLRAASERQDRRLGK